MANYDTFKRIDSEAIIDGTVAAADIAANNISGDKIAPGGVEEADISNAAITSGKFDPTNFDISGKTVTYRPIADGDISSSAAIAGSKFASGAMASNLGGTPVNRASPTVSSASFGVAAGNTVFPGIYSPSNRGTGIKTGNPVELVANETVGIRMYDTATSGQQTGIIQKPNNVSFTGSGTSGWRYANSYGGTRWRSLNNNFGWAIQQSGGSNFSGGRFTAPTAGFYQFHFETYARNNANNTSGYYHLSFGINGGNAMVGGRTPHGIFAHSTGSRYYPNGTMMDLGTYLNAGQYVEVRVYWNNNQTRFHGAHSCFNGYMIA